MKCRVAVVLSIGLTLAAATFGCGDVERVGLDQPTHGTAAGDRDSLQMLDYLRLKSDALTSDKMDWRRAMEIARDVLVRETGGAREYQLNNLPESWYNATQNVVVYCWLHQADRDRIITGIPDRGYLVVLDANSGEVVVSGEYQRSSESY